MFRYLIGIDEVGRGPLAGPVTVCALAVKTDILRGLGHINDSKGLGERTRRDWYFRIQKFKEAGDIEYAVTSIHQRVIDEIGIAPAIRRALATSLAKLACDPAQSLVLLDGGLRAPEQYEHQETIVRGDATESVIALASIVAKVTRDAKMVRAAKQYPGYGFERHKGYGTREHRDAILRLGPTDLHRRSFLSKLLD